MNILTVRFRYEGMSEAELRATCDQIAPNFATIPGCLEKTWLVGPDGDAICGGIYKFRDRASLDAYVASELFKGVESTPQFADFEVRAYDVMEGPTAVTHGIPATATAR